MMISSTRARVLRVVESAPGCTIRDVAHQIERDESTARYQLLALEKLGLLVSQRAGRAVVHYSNGWGNARDRTIASLSVPARIVLRFVESHRGARAADVARWAAKPPIPLGVVRHALRVLEKRGLVRRVPYGRFEVMQ